MTYTGNTKINEVINDSAFHGKGRLLFPVQRGYMSGNTLGSMDLTWYSEIDGNMTVTICNHLKERAEAGEKIFFGFHELIRGKSSVTRTDPAADGGDPGIIAAG